MRAKCSATVVIAFLGTLLPPAAGGAEASQRRQVSKQDRPAVATRVVRVEDRDGAGPAARSIEFRIRSASDEVSRGERAYVATGGSGGISCVPYARLVSGIQVTGNGGTWWGNAAGLYDRDQRPEPGSVLAFRSSGGMSMGHVAVVQRSVGAREIEIEHANWAGPGIRKGQVLRNVSVVDVSDANDWTAVRVEVGRGSGSYGRVYPTYGFIHNRRDGVPGRGTVRYASGSAWYEEVAEAAAAPRASFTGRTTFDRGIDLTVGSFSVDGPSAIGTRR